MSTAVLDKLRTERDETRSAALAIAQSDTFDPEDETYKDLETRAETLDARIASLSDLLQKQAAADALDGKMSKSLQAREDKQETKSTGRSWGELFVRSEVFTDYRGRGTSAQVEIEADIQARALPTGLADLVAAGFEIGDKHSVDITPPVAPTPLLTAISNIQVSTNAVEFVKWEKKAGGAAKVAEKAVKPSVEYGPVVTSDTLDNIAVWTQLTRQMLEDKRAVRDRVDGELRREILRAEEADAAAVLAAAALPTATTSAAAGGTLLKSIRVGIGTVQAAGFQPNAVLLNPADYADLDIDVMGATLGGPAVGRNFWGLIPIPVSSQPEGTATVGDMKAGVERYIRSEVGLYVTDSHAETFISNVFTLLAERRSLTAVVRPQALVECSVAA